MNRASHLPFSPDLASSDFSLFEKLKNALMRTKFTDEPSLVDGVIWMSASISRGELEAVFAEWLVKLENWIQMVGGDVE
jgi:hypothetical protein